MEQKAENKINKRGESNENAKITVVHVTLVH